MPPEEYENLGPEYEDAPEYDPSDFDDEELEESDDLYTGE